jgi:hypothetical protein
LKSVASQTAAVSASSAPRLHDRGDALRIDDRLRRGPIVSPQYVLVPTVAFERDFASLL